MNQITVPEFTHRTVLLEEAVDALAIEDQRRDGIYVDGTFGRGGHSRKILQRLSERGRLIAFDKDPQAIAAAEELAREDARFVIVHDSFASMTNALIARGVQQLDGIVMDLGLITLYCTGCHSESSDPVELRYWARSVKASAKTL